MLEAVFCWINGVSGPNLLHCDSRHKHHMTWYNAVLCTQDLAKYLDSKVAEGIVSRNGTEYSLVAGEDNDDA